ncbi:MAG TPA: endonuclease V [Kineosporiaceae bacterium]|nr:endonuclease V [Kineosporiaceae bacterium]
MSELQVRCAATDVYYPADGGAVAAVVICSDARYEAVTSQRTVLLAEVEAYRPGEFFRRELPALRAVLAGTGPLDLLIVDGYVDLDPDGRPGLGAHAHAEFAVPVIGVAKTAFATATHAVPVHRGQGTRPLYVTAAGIRLPEAADLVRAMAGPYRLPNALRLVDRLTRP